MRRLVQVVIASLLAGGTLGPIGVQAQTQAHPSAVYVFGDSLSDRGNLAEAYYHQNLPNPPSYHDSFTNGDVAVQVMANQVGLTVDPSLWVTGFKDPFGLFGGASFTPGTNYAVAGATAAYQAVGGPSSINLPQQVAAYDAFAGDHADPNALYTFIIGGNDVRNAVLQSTGVAAITAGVDAEIASINKLLSEGAENILVVNVPDVGAIPEFSTKDMIGLATTYSQAYDTQLSAGLGDLKLGSGQNVRDFDLYTFGQNLSAELSASGFDTTDACYTNTPLSATTSTACGPNAANISKFYYWDDVHPTAYVDERAGKALAAYEFGGSSVPEPATWAMMLIGLGAVGLAIRRQNRIARFAR